MQFGFYTQDAQTHALLEKVFARAWEKARLKHTLVAQPENEKDAREELAKSIAEAHEDGERDPAALELIGLRTFDRWTTPEETGTR